jgi:hypothetical protein
VGGKGLFDAYIAVLNSCKVDFVLIADQDYLEQVGSEDIKSLFTLNEREIKEDVVENIKSLDGAALVASIDQAISSGQWGDAAQVWEYIKSRRRAIAKDLTDAQCELLDADVERLASEGIFVLPKGALETYLPIGYRDKNLNNLIRLVRGEDFWEQLDREAQETFRQIAHQILSSPSAAGIQNSTTEQRPSTTGRSSVPSFPFQE